MSKEKKEIDIHENELNEEQMEKISGGIELAPPNNFSSHHYGGSIDYFDTNSK